MRKIDIYAQENFNGNIEQAIEHLLCGEHGDTKYIFDQYVDELTLEESKFAMKIIHRQTVNSLGEKQFNDEVHKLNVLQQLNLTEEEVKNAPVNPYKSTLLKSVFKLLVMNGGVISLAVAGIAPQILGLAAPLVMGLSSMTVATNLVNYFKFKKIKSKIDSFPGMDEQIESRNNKR